MTNQSQKTGALDLPARDAPDERLEHGGLPGGLRPHDRNLGELQVAADILHARLREDVLELVDQRDEAVP